MFRAFALVLAFFVGMLGCTTPAVPHDAETSVARATDPGECAINTAPRDQLEQGSGTRGTTERVSVGADQDALLVTVVPLRDASTECGIGWVNQVEATRPRVHRGSAAARGPPLVRA